MTNGHKLVKILLACFLDMNQKAKFGSWNLVLNAEKVELKQESRCGVILTLIAGVGKIP